VPTGVRRRAGAAHGVFITRQIADDRRVARLAHLNLTVADKDLAMAFYRRWFGFDRVLAEYPDGTTFVTNGDGFELALHTGPSSGRPDWHFGFIATSAEEVRELRSRMESAAGRVWAAEDTPEYVGFKCHDPAGHEIEVYFELRS
jgi:predicted enzyme related to lactoylglutathione lyase